MTRDEEAQFFADLGVHPLIEQVRGILEDAGVDEKTCDRIEAELEAWVRDGDSKADYARMTGGQ